MFKRSLFAFQYYGNELHNIIKSGNSLNLDKYTRSLDKNKLRVMASELDDRGKIPFKLLCDNAGACDDEDLFYSCSKTLFEPIESEKLPCSKFLFDCTNISKSNHVMMCAAFALNHARAFIKNSHTLSLINRNTDRSYLKEIFNQINQVRTKANDKATNKKEFYELLAEFSISEGVGNCEELSAAVCKSFKEQNFPYRSELFVIKNGDHAFNVIGRDENSNENDPSTWGESALIADAWSAEIFAKDRIPEKLKDFKIAELGEKRKYFLADFNPVFHKLKSEFEYKPESKPAKLRLK